MKRRTAITLTTVALAGAALLAWAFSPRPVDVEVATATRGPFETTVDEDGKTRLRDRYLVSAPLAGMLSRITLREGDAVEADAVVATLTPVLSPMLDARTVREQQLRVEVAEAKLQRARARIEAAAVAVKQAEEEVRRSEQLSGQGFVSASKLDTDRLAALAARKDADTAREEAHAAGHEGDQARAALAAVQQPRGRGDVFAVRAPVGGRVLRVLQPSEGVVPLGAPLLELGDVRRLEVVAELLTTDALQARPGTRVRIERWGGEGTLEGRVRLVEPGAFTKISALGVEEQRVKVLIDLASAPERWAALGDGYRVEVRIVTRALDGVVRVPVGAVFPISRPPENGGTGGDMAVFVIRDGRAHRLPVEVGARNGTDAWVKAGLDAGATVAVYPPAALRDGARVAIRSVRAP
jgi:HlyD family secretion protein